MYVDAAQVIHRSAGYQVLNAINVLRVYVLVSVGEIGFVLRQFYVSVYLKHKDTGLEDVDLVEHIDIDFDQFGAQPPDLPVLDTSNNEEVEMNVNEVDGIFSSSGEEGTDTSTEASESEHQIKKLVSENEDEQGGSSLCGDSVRTECLRTLVFPVVIFFLEVL